MNEANKIMKEFIAVGDAQDAADVDFQKQKDALDQRMREDGPVKIGDVVEVTGFPHKGKKMIVVRVFIRRDYFDGIGVKAIGKVLKADGTPGKNQAESFFEVRPAP